MGPNMVPNIKVRLTISKAGTLPTMIFLYPTPTNFLDHYFGDFVMSLTVHGLVALISIDK